jgi:hypothetical protein
MEMWGPPDFFVLLGWIYATIIFLKVLLGIVEENEDSICILKFSDNFSRTTFLCDVPRSIGGTVVPLT